MAMSRRFKYAKAARVQLAKMHRKSAKYGATPNAALTGLKGSLCYDTANDELYINTDGATAWTNISP